MIARHGVSTRIECELTAALRQHDGTPLTKLAAEEIRRLRLRESELKWSHYQMACELRNIEIRAKAALERHEVEYEEG